MLRSKSKLSSSIIFISLIDLLFIIIIVILYSYPQKNPESQFISPKLTRELGRVEIKTQENLGKVIGTLAKKTSRTNQETVESVIEQISSRLKVPEQKSEGSLSAPYFKTIDSSIFFFARVTCIHDAITKKNMISLRFQPDLSKLDDINKMKFENLKKEYTKKYKEDAAITPKEFSDIFKGLSKEGSLIFITHSWPRGVPILQADVTAVMQEIDKCFTRVSGAAR